LLNKKQQEASMARKKRMATLWEVPDDLWERISQLLDEYDPPKATGRKREDARKILDGLLFRFRTGCQWNHIPSLYGDDSTLHRTFQRWEQIGLFEKLWSLLIEECDELGQVDWQWQSADTALGKARGGGDEVGANPTDRAKEGTKRSLLVEAEGGPLALVVAPANKVDAQLLEATIEAIVVERPKPTAKDPQHLCLDKAYDNPTGEAAVEKYNYTDHIRRKGEEKLNKKTKKKHPARRWVVERTLAWLSKCRGLLVRYEKKSRNYLALLQFACALLWYRRLAYSSF
jgi:putative transposase